MAESATSQTAAREEAVNHLKALAVAIEQGELQAALRMAEQLQPKLQQIVGADLVDLKSRVDALKIAALSARDVQGGNLNRLQRGREGCGAYSHVQNFGQA